MLLEQFSLHFNQVHELLSITLIPLSNLQKRYYLKQGSKPKKNALYNSREPTTSICNRATTNTGVECTSYFLIFFWAVALERAHLCPLIFVIKCRQAKTVCFHHISSYNADSIQAKPVKHVIYLISSPLSYIFNICLSNGEFPTRVQLVKVSELYTKGDTNDPSRFYQFSLKLLE